MGLHNFVRLPACAEVSRLCLSPQITSLCKQEQTSQTFGGEQKSVSGEQWVQRVETQHPTWWGRLKWEAGELKGRLGGG